MSTELSDWRKAINAKSDETEGAKRYTQEATTRPNSKSWTIFYRDGIHVTGIDTIIAKSGVAKTTLYRYFPSKDDLVVAYLQERPTLWECIEAAMNQASDDPK